MASITVRASFFNKEGEKTTDALLLEKMVGIIFEKKSAPLLMYELDATKKVATRQYVGIKKK